MMIQINAVTTSVIINVTTILIATAAPVESSSSDSSSSDSSSTGYIKIKISMKHLFAFDRLMYTRFLMLVYVRAITYVPTVPSKCKFTPASILLSSPLKSTLTQTASRVVSTHQSFFRCE